MVFKRFEVISKDWLLSKQGVVKYLSYDKYEKLLVNTFLILMIRILKKLLHMKWMNSLIKKE